MGNKPRRITPRPPAAATARSGGGRPPWLQWAIVGGAVVVVAVLLVLAFGGLESSNVTPPEGIVHYSDLPRTHTAEAVTYPQSPPVGGPHYVEWLNCGFYSTPVPNELAVHTLEHGVVWITFDPGLPQGEIDTLRKRWGGENQVLVSPFPGLDSPVVASSWGNQIRLTGVGDPRLADFVLAMRDGPDTPEPAAGCGGGVGTPG